ncbi:hypothetical protein [Planococcus sp. YIM B11945]|uniref:hypothetical protein n=1 Tax=Planococcus sp. YIM B11945 TaxID=3435410 RepID=UPI003D7CC967
MFSNDQLKELIEGKTIGDAFPYNTKNEQEIEAHIRRLVFRIKRIPHLQCEAEWDHFGSGYASFVELFCWRKEDVAVRKVNTDRWEEERQGIIIDVCRLALAAIMGEDVRYKVFRDGEEIGGAYGSLLDAPNRLRVSEHLQPAAEQIKLALNEFHLELLEAAAINRLLPFQAKIPTLYRNPKDYLTMDALFYWED